LITLWGRAFVDGEIRERTAVTFAGEQIADVRDERRPPRDAIETDGVIVPGFIDVHVHGADGFDIMDATAEAVAGVTRYHARHGTTALAATTLSASREHLHEAVLSVARAHAQPAGEGGRRRTDVAAEICGIHLEGPFLSAAKAGAQSAGAIRPADGDETAALLAEAPRLRWMMTVAPEVEGVLPLIERFRERILFSIGHTAATYEQCCEALMAGASHFTHLFNAMTGLDHRAPGAVGAALSSVDATAELIADTVHVHKTVLRIAALAMPHRVALITDAVRACGMPEGRRFKLYDREIEVRDGAARLAGGDTLAGSVLTMNRAVQNMVEAAALPLELVLPLASEVPARILGVANRKGKLARGYDADVVVLSPRFDVEHVFVRGSAAL
jgi:N-acetylglucosamine-6-phosphate deacetylase